MPPATRSSASATERGSSLLVAVLCLAVLVGGLSISAYQQNRGAGVDVQRTEGLVRALELAEIGVARAEVEIASQVDADGDGVGNVRGTYAGGTFATAATSSGNDWTIVSTGRTDKGARRVEQGVRRIPASGGGYGLFSDGDLKLDGVISTDSYDSRVGSYASQAVNVDANGPYARPNGPIGSNQDIILNKPTVWVRGDATPGPLSTVSMSGGPTVTGSTAPRAQPAPVPATPLTEFQAAWTTNANETWTGGGVTYVTSSKTFTATSGTVVFPPGTYAFSKFTLSGGAVAKFLGPTKIYVTSTFDTSGGQLVNTTHDPSSFRIYSHGYPLPGNAYQTTPTIKIAGGPDFYVSLYSPTGALNVVDGDFYGGFVAGTAKFSGPSRIHYDEALANVSTNAASRVEETYWAERSPPLR